MDDPRGADNVNTPIQAGPWKKSTRSNFQANCVEVFMRKTDGVSVRGVMIRDSKNPDGPRLHVSAGAWTALIGHIKRDTAGA